MLSQSCIEKFCFILFQNLSLTGAIKKRYSESDPRKSEIYFCRCQFLNNDKVKSKINANVCVQLKVLDNSNYLVIVLICLRTDMAHPITEIQNTIGKKETCYIPVFLAKYILKFLNIVLDKFLSLHEIYCLKGQPSKFNTKIQKDKA